MLILLTGIFFVSCNNNENKKQQGTTEIAQIGENNVSYKIGDHVPTELVCMVNNAFMGKAQMEVPVDGKMYYGCCEMCVGRLNNDESSRMATDPFSGNAVDKAEAYIVLADEEGRVDYYESEENYRAVTKE